MISTYVVLSILYQNSLACLLPRSVTSGVTTDKAGEICKVIFPNLSLLIPVAKHSSEISKGIPFSSEI